jgi:hypothetical protein
VQDGQQAQRTASHRVHISQQYTKPMQQAHHSALKYVYHLRLWGKKVDNAIGDAESIIDSCRSPAADAAVDVRDCASGTQ